MEMEEKLIPVSDMYLVAILISYGHQYSYINRDDPRRLEFMFPDKASTVYILRDGDIAVLEYLHLDQVQTAYTCKTLMPMPSVFDAIRAIKSVIHGKK
jgi:hypothetical protein